MDDDITEENWLHCENPHFPYIVLSRLGVISPRKCRLAAVGCARRVWKRLSTQHHEVIELAERYADKQVSIQEVKTAFLQCDTTGEFYWVDDLLAAVSHRQASSAIHRTLGGLFRVSWGDPGFDRIAGGHGAWHDPTEWKRQCRAVCQTFRCIFGNPFRPVSLEPAWRTASTRNLAQAIYEERTFDHLPVLADALEEAGCTEAAILKHCRQPQEHVRGCWVVDLLLKKK